MATSMGVYNKHTSIGQLITGMNTWGQDFEGAALIAHCSLGTALIHTSTTSRLPQETELHHTTGTLQAICPSLLLQCQDS